MTVWDAIGDLPEPTQESDDRGGVMEYYDAPGVDDDWYRSSQSGLYLPRSDYAKEMHAEPVIPEPIGTAISLFSGCGGFDLGTTMAGFSTRVFIENDKSAVETLRHNAALCFPDAVILDDDIRRITIEQILRAAELERGECDLITGGFPCQPFSMAGKRKGRADDRGNLFYDCSRIIEGVQPRAYLLENVPGLLTSNGGADIAAVCDELTRVGYPFVVMKLNAVNYGVPQDRQRVFFWGMRADVLGERSIEKTRLKPTHGDPRNGLTPTFEPVYRWDGTGLVLLNEPAPGQSRATGAGASRRIADGRTDSAPSLFDDADDGDEDLTS